MKLDVVFKRKEKKVTFLQLTKKQQEEVIRQTEHILSTMKQMKKR